MITRFSVLHIRNVGTRGIQRGPLFGLGVGTNIRNVGTRGIQRGPLVGLGVGTKSGRHLRFEQVLDFLHRLPWLRSLLSRGRVGGLRLEPS
jgi:hypothetical protein